MGPIKHVLPDGAGVVLDARCALCEGSLVDPRNCPACHRGFCGSLCFEVHLNATDNEADEVYAASRSPHPTAAPPEDLGDPACRRCGGPADLIYAPCECGWSLGPLCAGCGTHRGTATGKPFDQHALSLHEVVCAKRAV